MAPIISGYTPRITTTESNQSVDFGKWLLSPNQSVRASSPSDGMDNRDRKSFANYVRKAAEAEQKKPVELRPANRVNMSDILDILA